MRLWRLTKREFIPGLDGEGARLAGGSWNSPGLPMVYCATSLALAALEVLVNLPSTQRRHGGLPPLVALALDIDDGLVIDPAFSARQDIAETRALGDTWLRGESNLGIFVPSRVIALERNVLINPRHPAMPSVTVTFTEAFVFDDRLAY